MSDSRMPGDLAAPSRIDNVEGEEHCRFCCQSPGYVVVGTRQVENRRYYDSGGRRVPAPSLAATSEPDGFYEDEELGPCPICQLGHKVEFPEKGTGPWGKEGFWRGMPHSALKPDCRCDEKPVEKREAREMIEATMASLRAIAEDEGRTESVRRAQTLEVLPAGVCDDCGRDAPARVRVGKLELGRDCAERRIRVSLRSDLHPSSSRFAPEEPPKPKPDAALSDPALAKNDGAVTLLDEPPEEVATLL